MTSPTPVGSSIAGRMSLVFRRALALVAAGLLLAACKVDTTVELKVAPDGSGTITITAVADKELVEKAPGLAEDLRFDDAVAAGWQVDGPTATDSGGLQVVVRHPFATAAEATALLASLNGPDGPLHDVVVTHTVTDDAVTTGLSGSILVSNGLDAFADPDVLAAIGGSPYANDLATANLRPADVLSFTFVADLPGTSAEGAEGTGSVATVAAPNTASTNGGVHTWTVPLDGTRADLTTTSVLRQGGGGGVWGVVATVALVALVVWVLAAGGFILFVARARRAKAMRRAAR